MLNLAHAVQQRLSSLCAVYSAQGYQRCGIVIGDIWEGLILKCGRGVLCCCMIDLAAASLLRDPSQDVWPVMIRFDALIPSSALPLD